jgi:serine/threonine-protein kinase
MPEIPLLQNRYQLGEQLGSGGMAVVYKARDLMLERTVAIKLLRQDFSHDPAFRERFRQEAKAAANLSHPNIVTVHDFGLDKGHIFIVMEYVPGTTLKEQIARRYRLDTEEGIPLVVRACAGIGYAHRAGLVHCDVKPQNILVTPDRRVKVMDFGIARALASIQPEERSEVVWGSPQYFSPEQAAGNPPSPASDVYSLGVVLYEALTGQLPFSADSPRELARMHREVYPRPPQEIYPGISENLNRIIMKVLSKEPSARYRTADQLGRVLITFTKKEDVLPEIPEAPPITAGPPEPIPIQPVSAPVPTSTAARRDPLDIDWVTAILGLLTLLAVGGLIPFWLWIYFAITPK